MACSLAQGFSLDCKDALGGVSDICIASYDTVVATGFVLTSGEITDLPTGITLWRYQVDDLSGAFSSPGTAEENGPMVYTTEITCRLRGITNTKRTELQLLSRNRVVLFVVPHRGPGWDKKIFAFGTYRGLQLTAGGFEHGAGMGDFTGLNLTFSGQTPIPDPRLVAAYTSIPFDNAAFSLTVDPAFPATYQ